MHDKDKRSSNVTRKEAKKGSSSVCYMDEFPDYFGLEKERDSKGREHSNETEPSELKPS